MTPYIRYMIYFENNFALVQVLEQKYLPYKKITMDKIIGKILIAHLFFSPGLLLCLSYSPSRFSQDRMMKQADKVVWKTCQLMHYNQLLYWKIHHLNFTGPKPFQLIFFPCSHKFKQRD